MSVSPQLEDGYTRIANEILEALCCLNLSQNEIKLLLSVLRKTYGYGKKKDYISLSQFSLLTKLQKGHVSRGLKSLIERKIVTRDGKFLGINKDISSWKNKLPRTVNLPATVNGVTSYGKKKLPSQEPQKKERKYTKEIYIAPNGAEAIKERKLNTSRVYQIVKLYYYAITGKNLDEQSPEIIKSFVGRNGRAASRLIAYGDSDIKRAINYCHKLSEEAKAENRGWDWTLETVGKKIDRLLSPNFSPND